MSDEISGAIVGGLIGFVGALIPLYHSTCYSRFSRAVEEHERYHSWVRGIVRECEHLAESANEVKGLYDAIVSGGEIAPPTKELNTDFLGQARSAIIAHPRSPELFGPLTKAFRDCIHTNDMMRRFEHLCGKTEDRPTLARPLASTIKSCEGVLTSISELRKVADEHNHYLATQKLHFRAYLFPLSLYCDCR